MDWDAAAYDRVSDPMTRWGTEVVHRLDLRGDETVLDAGCGSGRVTAVLLERLPHGRVIGVDASAAMLAQAGQRLGDDRRVRLLHADLITLSPATLDDDAPVDAILSTATFHWVPDHARLFANLHAVMRFGAQLEAQCGAAGNLETLLSVLEGFGLQRPQQREYATAEVTREQLTRAGFEDVRTWTHEQPTTCATVDDLCTYLEAICLRDVVAGMDGTERHSFLRAVAAELPDGVIDYVRLDISARRA